jgi:hypothetical protein
MVKFKELGIDQGVQITRPWNPEMFHHNNQVRQQMCSAIQAALHQAWATRDEETIRCISKAINAYGYGEGFDIEAIKEDAVKGLEQIANYWLNESCWMELIRARIVGPIAISFVGYKK